MKNLIGKHINKLLGDKTFSWLVFETTDGQLSYYAEGDCCSSSWFEHLSGVEALIDSTVVDVEFADGGAEDRSDYEYLQWDFIIIVTNKGRATIEFRNSSNGYYSGWAELRQDPPENLEPIIDDF